MPGATFIKMLRQQHHDGRFFKLGDVVEVGTDVADDIAAKWLGEDRAEECDAPPPNSQMSVEERTAKILDAVRKVLADGEPDKRPTVKAVAAIAGFPVKAADIDVAVAAIEAEDRNTE